MNEEKIEFIKANKALAVAALNTYLDAIYDLTDDFCDEEGNRKAVLPSNPEVEDFLNEVGAGAREYENVRQKLNNDDFNLSTLEINYIALAFLYVTISIKREMDKIQKTYTQAVEVYNKLTAAATES